MHPVQAVFIQYLQETTVPQHFGYKEFTDENGTKYMCAMRLLAHMLNPQNDEQRLGGIQEQLGIHKFPSTSWPYLFAMIYLNDALRFSFKQLAQVMLTHPDRLHFTMSWSDAKYITDFYPPNMRPSVAGIAMLQEINHRSSEENSYIEEPTEQQVVGV